MYRFKAMPLPSPGSTAGSASKAAPKRTTATQSVSSGPDMALIVAVSSLFVGVSHDVYAPHNQPLRHLGHSVSLEGVGIGV